ncbi:hypothetical protein VTG60DRAFT_2300 [Thermothelomyces hinnuleus]
MMDFSTFFLGALPPHGANISHHANGSAKNRLPDNILNILSLLPGFQFNPLTGLFMLLHNVVGRYIGINPTDIVTVFAMVWAANKLWHQLYSTFNWLLHQHFKASIDISSSDVAFLHVKWWLASHLKLAQNDNPVSPDGSNCFNVSKREAKASLQFTPAMGVHSFWFRGRYFILERKQESVFNPTPGAHGMPRFENMERIVLSCFGRSPEPIKQLLQHVKERYYDSHQTKTSIWRPAQPPRNWRQWQQVGTRLVRPMPTVVLDDEQKIRILSDIQGFIIPRAARFYADRGIPLRRGYMFYGPPGTGKTSLCFALAGVFGLDIYYLSLLDSTLTEEGLLNLFVSLSRRCIVLLEDIDTAGLKRAKDPTTDSSSLSSSSDEEDNKHIHSDKDEHKKSPHKRKNGKGARNHKRHGNNDSSDEKGISLSGLLNAIDGIASQEGRVLAALPCEDDGLLQESHSELAHIAAQFAAKIPPGKFSQAEIQGFLLMRKNTP